VVVDVNGDGDGTRASGQASKRRGKCAIELVAFSAAATNGIPEGFCSLSEQVRRAALSVPLNIAQGAGRNTEADAARHYAIARGSAMECAAGHPIPSRPPSPSPFTSTTTSTTTTTGPNRTAS
jgi:hypothetical protein